MSSVSDSKLGQGSWIVADSVNVPEICGIPRSPGGPLCLLQVGERYQEMAEKLRDATFLCRHVEI